MTSACSGAEKTCQPAVFLKRQTTEWWRTTAWGGHVCKKRRMGMKVGRRDERWDEKLKVSDSYSPRLFSFLSPAQCRSKFCTINKLTRSLKHRRLSETKIKAKWNVWSPAVLLLVSPSHHWPCPPNVRLSDRDAGLISTDAKDLKVSFSISHHGWVETAEELREETECREGRGGRERGWGLDLRQDAVFPQDKELPRPGHRHLL